MPASPECFSLFQQITTALQDCGLANSHHDINLSRGASWVRSKCGKKGPLKQQNGHFDYDTTAVRYDRLQLPMSIFIYFQETKLIIKDTECEFSAGDILLLLGDCPHAGSNWQDKQVNLRLFCFLPTNTCLPVWESGHHDIDANAWKYYPFTVPSDITDREALIDTTIPGSESFSLDAYNAHAFCSAQGKFFKFDVRSWYNGLQTIVYNSRSCYSGTLIPMFSSGGGVCLHWPSRSALNRAGMLDDSRACSETFKDLRHTDCPDSSCERSKSAKRSRSPSSSASVTGQKSSSKVNTCVHTHIHTHTTTYVAADGTETQQIITTTTHSSSATSSSSSVSTATAAGPLPQ